MGAPARPLASYHIVRKTDPARTEIYDRYWNWKATLTDNAYTVTLVGRGRFFTENSTPYYVYSTTWVRLLPAPFNGHVNGAWVVAELKDTSPDVLQMAMQYIYGAPPIYDGTL